MNIKNDFKIISKWLIILWIIVLFGTIIICTYLYKNTLSYAQNVVKSLVDKTTVNIESFTVDRLYRLEIIAREIEDEILASPKEGIDYFKSYREEYNFRNMNVALLDGTSYTKDGNKVNLSHREYFQQALEKQSTISTVLASANDGVTVNVYATPVYRDEQVVAVLWASIHTFDFYNMIDFSELEPYGEVYIVNSNTDLLIQKDLDNIDLNFYEFIESYGGINDKNLNDMKEDISFESDGYKAFTYNGEEVIVYYSKMKVKDWWLLLKVNKQHLLGFIEKEISIVLIGTTVLLVIVSIGILNIAQKSMKMHRKMKLNEETDLVTEGKNDNYMISNIPKIINGDIYWVLIEIEIKNIEQLTKVIGLKNVNDKLKQFYNKIDSTLKQNEVVAHSYLGNFKVLKSGSGLSPIIEYVNILNQLDPNLQLIMGIYPIEKGLLNYNEMCLYTTVAKSDLVPGHNYGIYSKECLENELKYINLEKDIDDGIKNQEFVAWFQPKYSIDGKTLCGAEALVRWKKGKQFIAPNIFIPVCEATGKIKNIDLIVLEHVCKHIRKWLDEGRQIVPISVNLSRNYLDNLDFINQIDIILKFYGITNAYIEFEITETSLEGSEECFKKVIDELHARGYKIALDDFGVGYSSIRTIATMGFDIIKLDKIFVDGVGTKKWENIIIYAIQLAKQVKAIVVAEGVETKDQYDFLAENGCDVMQGYYFGKPMNHTDFEKLI